MHADLTPNMYDDHDMVNIEQQQSMTVVSIEDLDPDQTVGSDNVDEPIPEDDNVIWDDEEPASEEDEGIYDDDELRSFGDDDGEEDDDIDDTGMDEDFFEDLNENDDNE